MLAPFPRFATAQASAVANLIPARVCKDQVWEGGSVGIDVNAHHQVWDMLQARQLCRQSCRPGPFGRGLYNLEQCDSCTECRRSRALNDGNATPAINLLGLQVQS